MSPIQRLAERGVLRPCTVDRAVEEAVEKPGFLGETVVVLWTSRDTAKES